MEPALWEVLRDGLVDTFNDCDCCLLDELDKPSEMLDDLCT